MGSLVHHRTGSLLCCGVGGYSHCFQPFQRWGGGWLGHQTELMGEQKRKGNAALLVTNCKLYTMPLYTSLHCRTTIQELPLLLNSQTEFHGPEITMEWGRSARAPNKEI